MSVPGRLLARMHAFSLFSGYVRAAPQMIKNN
jgi:hypothetical protein